MELAIGGVFFVAAALAVAAMGFAIERGATCTVAAVDELLTQRRASRLVALVEASLWVTMGLAITRQLHWLARPPAGFALSGWTVAGAALLGLGAFVNRACVFGAITRLGSGEWAYLATPLGFYAGCLSVGLVFTPPAAHMLEAGSIVFSAADWVVWPLLAYLVFRIAATVALCLGCLCDDVPEHRRGAAAAAADRAPASGLIVARLPTRVSQWLQLGRIHTMLVRATSMPAGCGLADGDGGPCDRHRGRRGFATAYSCLQGLHELRAAVAGNAQCIQAVAQLFG